MKNLLLRFRDETAGAVTVDWVVLTAAIVGLGLLAVLAVKPSIESKSNEITVSMAKTTSD